MKNFGYFYLDTTELKNGQEYYTVIKVQVFNHNIDEADRKARTVAIKLNQKLAGGYFLDKLPYNFKTNYTVINCPINTKIDPYNEKDLFIQNLIEQESSMQFSII